MKRSCLDCRQVFTVERPKQSRCDYCAGLKRRGDYPRSAEPWRLIYGRREWHRARHLAQERDGWRCRAMLGGRRCGHVLNLQVHHDPPLEELWSQSGGNREWFIELATELRHLVTLCVDCHARADALRREAAARESHRRLFDE